MKDNIKLLIFAILLVSLLSINAFSQEKFGGIALYTLREEMKINPKEVLNEVATIGYKYIEAADYSNGQFYGMRPQEFKNYLNSLGLIPISTHQAGITYNNADAIIADVKAAGFQYLVVPMPPMGHFEYDEKTNMMGMNGGAENLAQILNTLGEKCFKEGIQLVYHNHDFEFRKDSEGIITMDYLLEHTDSKYVNFQMDLYWVIKAGSDPIIYFKKYPGRFKIWHVKDMDRQGRFAPIGTGIIDFTRIIEMKEMSGMEFYFVELDFTYNMKPIEAIKISHQALIKMKFN